MRAEPSHKNEMVSQVLFGEEIRFIKEEKEWVHISTLHDNYEGWIEKKNFALFRESKSMSGQPSVVSHSILIPDGKLIKNYLPFGSLISEELFYIEPDLFEECTIKPPISIPSAIQLLNDVMTEVPYLWGGRTVFGIDCSGLTQMFGRVIGISLLRDAKQQATQGMEINFETRQAGDLVFFQNENEAVVHTGICINKEHILHASGQVRIDVFKMEGIIHQDYQIRTHHFHSIRRMKL